MPRAYRIHVRDLVSAIQTLAAIGRPTLVYAAGVLWATLSLNEVECRALADKKIWYELDK